MEPSGFAPALGFRTGPPRYQVRLVRRPDLLARLDESLKQRLILIQAPAGYGKTVLLAQWREQLIERDQPVVWLTLDRNPSPIAFVRWLQMALAEAGILLGPVLDNAVQAGHGPDGDTALDSILHSLEERRASTVIILDGYQFAQSRETDRLLQRLLREMPEGTTLTLSSRERPLVDVAMLHAMGELAEIDQSQLRFTDLEASRLIGAPLPPLLVSALNNHVQGWAIALQLANLRIRTSDDVVSLMNSFSGTIADMADYMASHILADLPEDLQGFLIETSVLDVIDAQTADATRGTANSRQFLDRLRHMGALLAPADYVSGAFRHHPLLADFLRAKQIQLDPARLADLHEGACRWFETAGDWVRAVCHARCAGNSAKTRALIEEALTLHLCLTDVPLARRLLNEAERSDVRYSLRLQVAAAALDFKDGNLSAGRCALERACHFAGELKQGEISVALDRDLTVLVVLRSIYQDVPVTDEELLRLEQIADRELDGSWLLGLSYIMRCLICMRRGELERAKATIFQAIRNLYDSDSLYARMFSNLHLGTVAFWQGHLAEAHNALRLAESMALEHFPGNAASLALAQVLLAEVAYEQNDLAHATELLSGSLEILGTSEIWSEIYFSGYRVALGLAAAARDDAAEAAAIDAAVAMATKCDLASIKLFALSQRISRLALAGRVGEAEHIVTAESLVGRLQDGAGLSWRAREALTWSLARLKIAQGNASEVEGLIGPMTALARVQSRQRSVLQSNILSALANHALGNFAAARACLMEAITWASVEGIVRPFVDEGPQMASLLQILSDQLDTSGYGQQTHYLCRLQQAFEDANGDREISRLVQLLTHRESQILAELVRGNSNKLIARHLDISEDGIKFHLKNMYRKLGVNTRVKAIIFAQKMNLV